MFCYNAPHRIVLAFLAILFGVCSSPFASADSTRLLRQPSLSENHIAFIYASDLWIVGREGGNARRLTSTPAVEGNPHFSPDGKSIAFNSNRSGRQAVYVLPVSGGTPQRLTWYPADSLARGWSRDGKQILYASARETAPSNYERLWTVANDGGPSVLLPAPWGHDGSYSSDGKKIVVDRVSRWDVEWRNYRGGQNTPLKILDLETLAEIRLPNERSTDRYPIWMEDVIYFLSDRDGVMNVWSFDADTQDLVQLTRYKGSDIKWLGGKDGSLVFERDGYLHTYTIKNGETNQIDIQVSGDFPWAETRWEDVSKTIRSSSLSPTGKRALFEARGEIFSVPVEKGSARNLTRSSGAADRAPVWSPDGSEIAWFSDRGDGYEMLVAKQDGLSQPRRIPIGGSKMVWEVTWSPDGKQIAFVDNNVRIQVLNVVSGDITTADVGGINVERGSMGLTWSPDSQWLAYAKTHDNGFRRITVWSMANDEARPVTDSMADAISPSWGRGGKHLYFLASTNLAQRSGWANTSQLGADPKYGAYLLLLQNEEETPFAPESDEEETKADDEKAGDDPGDEDSNKEDADTKNQKASTKDKSGDSGESSGNDSNEESESPDAKKDDKTEDPKKADGKNDDEKKIDVKIDFDGIERRILSVPMPVRNYRFTLAGPTGNVFIGERVDGAPGILLHKYSFKDRKSTEFTKGAGSVSLSADGKKLLYRSGSTWHVEDTSGPAAAGKGQLKVSLMMNLDRMAEWKQMFDEAWHYQRSFFYDPNMHGRDWQVVKERYAPLIPFVRHRADLNYVIDQVNGELSVGHSFVSGGDMPQVDSSKVGTLGANLVVDQGRWKFDRILTFESWNPSMKAPLDRPGLKVKQGDFLVGINGVELTDADDPYRLLDGTVGIQTILHVNDQPTMEDARQVTVEPIGSEFVLRQRGWVEDNRRRVDELSDGKLAYVWVPNTSTPGLISFDRYLFAQQDKWGAVIDERFNGGGLLDDYMVDLMTRTLRAALTNEVPNGRPFRLPTGVLGPKVLLINEKAGSGGDYFPWAFRQQNVGPLIGTRTWGGLVKSSVHYPLIDGGRVTAPDNAVFDPINNEWIAENKGIAPDIEVRLDAVSVAAGRDPQLERGVEELLKMIEENPMPAVTLPPYSAPARGR